MAFKSILYFCDMNQESTEFRFESESGKYFETQECKIKKFTGKSNEKTTKLYLRSKMINIVIGVNEIPSN